MLATLPRYRELMGFGGGGAVMERERGGVARMLALVKQGFSKVWGKEWCFSKARSGGWVRGRWYSGEMARSAALVRGIFLFFGVVMTCL